MKIVYIAGPYGDKDGYLAIDRNIAKARDAAAWCAARGIGFICPHLNSAHFEAIVPVRGVEFWYEMDLRLLSACDAMLVLEGWQDSTGTQREMAEWDGPTYYFQNHESRARLIDWVVEVPA